MDFLKNSRKQTKQKNAKVGVSKKAIKKEKKKKAKKQHKSKTNEANLTKKGNKLRRIKQRKSGKDGLSGRVPPQRVYTCNGTSLGDTCLSNLLNSLKFEKDKIRTFTNQKKRAESFKKLIGKKGGKDDQFGNTTTYLLMALGGNMTNLNCSGKTSLTTEAAATYT